VDHYTKKWVFFIILLPRQSSKTDRINCGGVMIDNQLTRIIHKKGSASTNILYYYIVRPITITNTIQLS